MKRAAFAVVCLFLSVPAVHAEFALVEDFQALTLGPVDGQAGWDAENDTSVVVVDPTNPLNQVLSVTTNSTHLHHQLQVLDGTTRMMFLRFRFGGQQAYSLGLSDFVSPDQFGHFEAELSMTNAGNELRINDGGTYDELVFLQPHTWYNVWMLIDNQNDVVQVWLNDDLRTGGSSADQLDYLGQTVFQFRDVTAGDLRNFFIKTGGGGSGNSGPLFIDDIYIETTGAINLANPAVRAIPTLSEWGLIGMAVLLAGAGGIVLIRRRSSTTLADAS